LEDAEVYAPSGNTTVPLLEMDRYAPAGGGPWPTVVMLHGGDSDGGAMAGLAAAVAERGALVYVPTYLDSGWPTLQQVRSGQSKPDRALGDIACAVRTARADAADNGGDPGRLVLVGFSRGGQIGAVVSLAGDHPAVTGSSSGNCLGPPGSAVPQAFVGLDGPYDWESFAATTEPELWAATDRDLMALISPLTYSDAAAPDAAASFYLVSSGQVTADGSFAEHAERFAASLAAAGYSVSTSPLPHLWHAAFQYPGVVPEVVDLIIAATG
jgi:acetyl esterase/lipase